MSLEIITGKPFDNISDIVFDKLLAASGAGKNTILIVPDQAQFETERRLYSRCKENGSTILFSSIEITTIAKLCDIILEKYQKDNLPADDITKDILMHCAIKNCKDELTAYKNIAEKPGFAGRMVNTVSMLKTAGFQPYDELADDTKALWDNISSTNQVLSAKFSDINRIYMQYDSLLGARYSDRLDSAAKAAKLAKENCFFDGKEVFLQDFDTFSANQRTFIDMMITAADKVTMAYITEYTDECRDIFQPLNNEIRHFCEIADDSEIIPVNTIDINCDDTVAGISNHIFGIRPETPESPASDSVTLVKANNVHSELDYVAAEIKRLCTEEGYRYNQIALLTPCAIDYKTSIESAFDKYEIPLFCDIPDSMSHMPLTNLVLSLLNVVSSFTVDNLLSYIKTGFVRINGKLLNDRDINHFEEFLFKWNIRPNDLKNPFPESPNAHDSTENAERIRKALFESISGLQNQLKNCDGAQITKIICEFILSDLRLNSSVSKQYMFLEENSDTLKKQLISSYQMQWNVLKNIFESMHRNLADINLSVKDYYQLFKDICSRTPLAKPPQVLDAVIAGDISRTKAYDIKVAFIVGAGFDNFPAETKQNGILSDNELMLLMEHTKLPLVKSDMDNFLYSQYQAYRALSLPNSRLYVCCPVFDISSNDVSPSDVFNNIKALYNIKVCDANSLEPSFYCRSEKAAEQRYASVYRSDSQEKADIKLAMKIASGSYNENAPDEQNTAYSLFLDKAASSRIDGYKHQLSPETASLIYRSDVISATKLEKLAKCPFSYFCETGLKINSIVAKEINPIEIGNAIHYALHTILRESFNSDKSYETFTQCSDTALEDIAKKALNEYKTEEMLGDFAKSNSFTYQYDNISIAVSDMLKLFREEFKNSKYRPTLYELNINKTDENSKETNADASKAPLDIAASPLAVQLDNGRTIYITGTIDRLDVLDDGNEKYIRVIDYKTGKKEFDGAEVKYGLNTQMLNYLMAVSNVNKDLKDGGISYIPSGVTSADSNEEKTFNERFVTDHSPVGIYVKYGGNSATETDIDSYNTGIKDAYSVDNGSDPIDKAAALITEEQFEQLKSNCMDSNKAVLTNMCNGKIDAIPTNIKKESPCKYCDFKDICGNNGNNFNMVEITKPSKRSGSASKKADISKGDTDDQSSKATPADSKKGE